MISESGPYSYLLERRFYFSLSLLVFIEDTYKPCFFFLPFLAEFLAELALGVVWLSVSTVLAFVLTVIPAAGEADSFYDI